MIIQNYDLQIRQDFPKFVRHLVDRYVDFKLHHPIR